jgi:Crp-like helix-turn-helix domain
MCQLRNFDDELTHIYFPNQNTVVSSLCTTDEHTAVEVGLCGSEGVVGIAALFGAETASRQNLVQVPGSGSRLTLSAAKTEFRVGGRFQDLVLRFAHAFFVQVAQTALCNRVHTDEERLARWLLLSSDRVAFHQLPLPRELLAKLLGRNLSGASVTAAILEKAGIIRYNGTDLVIADREKLESVACSCYWLVRRHAAKLLEPLQSDHESRI